MFKKTVLPLLCFLLLAGLAQAQPVLQGNVVPNIGDATSFATADTNSVQPGNPGANQTWNFSNLAPLYPPTPYQYIAPAGTPYAAEFPSANLVTKIGGGDTVIYAYARKEANQLLLLGSRSITYEQDYINPDAQIKYPTNYNDNYYDTYSYTTDAGTGFPFLSYGSHSVTYDAYGTMTTPLGTFPNTMRIRAQTYQTDSSYFFGNEIINHHDYVTYDWLVADQPGPLVTVSYFHVISETRIIGIDTLFSESNFKSVNYISAGSVGAFEPAKPLGSLSEFSVGPNPASDQLTLRFTAAQNVELQVRLTDPNGRTVQTRALSAAAGENSLSLRVADLPSGAYFVTLSDGRGAQSWPWQKF